MNTHNMTSASAIRRGMVAANSLPPTPLAARGATMTIIKQAVAYAKQHPNPINPFKRNVKISQ